MLGHGAIGQYAIGEFSQGAAAEIITIDKWFVALSEPARIRLGLFARYQQSLTLYPLPVTPSMEWLTFLSEPVRQKIGLRAQLDPFESEQNLYPTVPFNWFNLLTEPVRKPPRLIEGDQQFTFIDLLPTILLDWFAALAEPVRKPPRLMEGDQQFTLIDLLPTILLDWFASLSEPKRFPIGLREDLMMVLGRGEFVPISYPATMNATEVGDFFLGVLYQFNPPLSALVSIIAPVIQKSTITSISSPPATQMAVSARVAIITGS